MNEESIQENSSKILIDAITGLKGDGTKNGKDPLRSVLEDAEKEIGADDVRFRLRDWEDKAVVYVPNWIIGPKEGEGLEKAEPELARRVYYDPKNPSRIDCLVGLVARIARIKEEEGKKGHKKYKELFKELKHGILKKEINEINKKIDEIKICFNDVKNEHVFNEFINMLEKKTSDLKNKKNNWKKYFKHLEKFREENVDDNAFFNEAFNSHECPPPWTDEGNAIEKASQWNQLKDYLEEWEKGKEVEKFLGDIEYTANRYEELHDQYKKYTEGAREPKCEIAVPVVAFGKFIGVLNFHKKCEKYLFSWDNVPGNDSERLLKFFRDGLDIDWAKNAEIRKSDNGKIIRIFKDENSTKIIIDEEKKNAKLKIGDDKIHDLEVKKENDKLKIYCEKNEFSKEDEYLARIYAARLAVTYLKWREELFEKFQNVALPITAESNFEVIALKIAEGVRTGLRHGLEENDVFPLLYVPKRPIDRLDHLTENEFGKIWKYSYQRRQKPPQNADKTDKESWGDEDKLGPIPIRFKGLGWRIVNNWIMKMQGKKQLKAEDRFTISIDVDDPNSATGSRSALAHGIKTTGCFPLTFGYKVYGLLYLHCKTRHFFTDVELSALEMFGNQAAIAINNAELTGDSYEKLYRNKLLDLLTGGE